MATATLRKIETVTYLGKIVDRKKSSKNLAKKKASRFKKAAIKSKKSIEKETAEYGGNRLPW